MARSSSSKGSKATPSGQARIAGRARHATCDAPRRRPLIGMCVRPVFFGGPGPAWLLVVGRVLMDRVCLSDSLMRIEPSGGSGGLRWVSAGEWVRRSRCRMSRGRLTPWECLGGRKGHRGPSVDRGPDWRSGPPRCLPRPSGRQAGCPKDMAACVGMPGQKDRCNRRFDSVSRDGLIGGAARNKPDREQDGEQAHGDNGLSRAT